MKKRSILGIRYSLWAMVIVSVSLSFLLFKYLRTRTDGEKKTQSVIAEAVNSQDVRKKAVARKDGSEDFSRVLKTIREMKKRVDSEHILESEADEGVRPYVPLTEEEARALKALHEKTGPYYWELAPQILEDIIRDESRDAVWQTDVETAAEKLFSEIAPKGTTLGKVNCRSTLCKIHFSHDDETAYKTFMDSRMEKGPWIGGAGDALGGYERGDNGELESFVYFSKKNDSDTFLSMRMEMASRIDEMENEKAGI